MKKASRLLLFALGMLLLPSAFATQLAFVGSGSYEITGSTVWVELDRLENVDNHASDLLQIRLMAMSTDSPTGQGYQLASRNLRTLPGATDGSLGVGRYFYDIRFSAPYTPPPDGNYWVYIIAVEESEPNTVLASLEADGNPISFGNGGGGSGGISTFDLTPGGSVTRSLTTDGVHRYRITLAQAGTLTLETTGSTDTVGRLYDNGSSGALLASNDDISTTNWNFRMSGTLAAGNYLLEVTEYDGEPGTYTLLSSFTPSGGSSGGGTPGGGSSGGGSSGGGSSGGGSSGGGSGGDSLSTPWQLGGSRFDGSANGAGMGTRFGIGLTRDGGRTFVPSASTGERVQILGLIQPDAAHVGQVADIYVVNRVNGRFMMMDQDGVWLHWKDGEPANLVPALEGVTLESVTAVSIHTGRIEISGAHDIFLGYMLDGELYYTPSPLPLNIEQGAPPAGGDGKGRLQHGTTGSGQGTLTPAAGEYEVGRRMTVYARPHTYSYFHSWTSNSGCAGSWGGCRIVIDEDPILMEARFEPIVWSTGLSMSPYQTYLEDGANQCTWTVTWTNPRLELRYTQSSSGYRGQLRFTGHRHASSPQSNCNGSDENISKTFEFAATGTTVNQTFLLRSGAGNEYMTVNIGDLNPGGHVVLGSIAVEYRGDHRRGGTTLPLVTWSQTGSTRQR